MVTKPTQWIACVACGADAPSDYLHCDACGAPLMRACADCGMNNRPSARFCGRCGRPLTAGATPPAAAPASSSSPPILPPASPEPRQALLLEGEHKVVSVLFADLRSSFALISGLEPEEALSLIEPALQVMVDAVRQFGGTVNRVQGDGVMALFGAPVAREDHAERACRAACQILAEMPKRADPRVGIRVGIHSGRVLVKPNLNDFTLDYDAIGEAAHLANRLEQLAEPGSACLSTTTVQLAGAAIIAESLGPTPIKGLTAPIETFRLVGMAAGSDRWTARARQQQSLSPFVGRDDELASLTRSLRSARAGNGRVATIVGEAGIGKSRLVHEVVREAADTMRILRAAAGPHDAQTPFHLIEILLRSWIGVPEGCPPAEIETKLDQLTDDLGHMDGAALAPLRFLLGLSPGDTSWDELEVANRRGRIAAALKNALLRSAIRRPLLIVLEDLHWCDAESRQIVTTIAEAVGAAPVMLLTTTRPDKFSFGRQSYSTVIQLQPLEADEAYGLLRRLLGDDPKHHALCNKLVEQTDGTPLFIEETVRMLIERGALSANGDPRASLDTVQIPDTVQAVIGSRIDRLRNETREVLRRASVIGKDVPDVLLTAIVDLPGLALDRYLAELCSAEFMFEANLSTGHGYTFKHALIQAVAYDGMLKRRRRELHASVMRAMETAHRDHLDDFVERLAHHATHGEEQDRAAHYLIRAGLRANARGAYAPANDYFTRAIQILRTLPKTRANIERGIEARLGLRVALLSFGDFRPTLGYMDEAEELARSVGDRTRLASVNISQANILVLLGEIDRALKVGTAGRDSADEIGDVVLRISATFSLAQAHTFGGNLREAIALLEGSLHILPKDPSAYVVTTGTPSVLYVCCLAIAQALSGDFTASAVQAATARRLAERTRRSYDLGYSRIAAGLLALMQGGAEQARTVLEEALAICEEASIEILVPSVARFLGLARARSGQIEDGIALLRDAVKRCHAKSLLAFETWCAASLGEALLMQGNLTEARAAAELARANAASHGLRPVEAHASRVLAAISHARTPKRPAAAVALYNRAARISAASRMQPDFARARVELAAILAESGRPHAAHRAVEAARDVSLALGMPDILARTEAVLQLLDQTPSPGAGKPAGTKRVQRRRRGHVEKTSHP